LSVSPSWTGPVEKREFDHLPRPRSGGHGYLTSLSRTHTDTRRASGWQPGGQRPHGLHTHAGVGGRALLFWAAAVLGLISCTGVPDVARSQHHESGITVLGGRNFGEVFAGGESIVLDEPPGVVTVWPATSLDWHGGFIVADTRESQVRVYARSGRLKAAYGRGTGTLDSLTFPVRAQRMADGSIIVAALSGHLTIMPERNDQAARTIETPLVLLRDLLVLSEHRVLLVGLESAPATAMLHILDTGTGQIVRSFFRPADRFDRDVTSTFPTVAVAHLRNRVAAAYTLCDTVIFFDEMGTEVSRLRIPIDPFIPLVVPLRQFATPSERQAWINQFTFIQDLFWVEDDRLLVQWAKGSPSGLQWGLAQMDTSGRREWAIAPAPRLMGASGAEFVFVDPAGAAINAWIVLRSR